MRKLTYASVVLVALIVTSIAVAHGIEGARSATAVAGTFSATAGTTTTRTCTTAEGKTIVVTEGKYTGTAAGDPDLTGPITLRARSVINTTDNVGVVNGRLSIDVAAGQNTDAVYAAVYSNGTIAGLAAGRAHQPHAQLLANLSAGFAAATGFTSGKLGGGTTGGSAVEVGLSSCKSERTTAEKSQAHGTISALSSSSITVAGLTCAIPSDKSADIVAKYKVGDTAVIKCELVSSVNTLTDIGNKHSGDNSSSNDKKHGHK